MVKWLLTLIFLVSISQAANECLESSLVSLVSDELRLDKPVRGKSIQGPQESFFKNGFRTKDFYNKSDFIEVRSTFNRWYSNVAKNEKIFEKGLSILGKQRVALLLDPGILSRKEFFFRFSKKVLRENPDISAFELRRLFSNKLGKTTVHRGVQLPKEGAQIKMDELVEQGLPPLMMTIEKSAYHNPLVGQERFLENGPFKDMMDRYSNAKSAVGLYSQSYTPNIKVAQLFAQAGDVKSARKGYVVTAEVPVLDTVDFFDLFFPLVENGKVRPVVTAFLRLMDKTFVLKSGDQKIWVGKRKTELFVFGPLEREWIKGHEEFSTNTNMYKASPLGLGP